MNLISFLQESQGRGWHRALLLGSALSLALSQTATGFASMAEDLGGMLQIKVRPAPYSMSPGPVYLGPRPGRDPIGRGGVWTPKLLADRAKVARQEMRERPPSMNELVASTAPIIPVLAGQTMGTTGGTGGSGGGTTGGEGDGPGGGLTGGTTGSTGETTGSTSAGGSSTGGMASTGGGGELNTNTGNRHVQYPLVGWEARGQNGVSFALHHNSKGTYSFDLGRGWSHGYDIKVSHTIGSSAIVRFGDGLEIPFTESAGTFSPPDGCHDTLVHNMDGTWKLTTRGQWEYHFNSAGKLTSIEDRNGNATTVSRNSSGKPTSISDGTGRQIEFTYNSLGLIETITDPLDREWTLTYDSSNNLIDLDYPELDSVVYDRNFTYDSAANILTETDRRGNTWTYTYNTDEQLLTMTNPLSKTWTWSYTSSAATLTNPDSETIVHNYSDGLIASAVDEDGFSIGLVYDSDRNVTQRTDQNGELWTRTYDSRGNVLTRTDPLGKTTTYTYNSTNDLLSIEDPLGNETELTYDSNGNLTEIEDALDRVRATLTYNSYGELIEAEDALGRTMEIGYDSYGNRTTTTNSANISSTADYNLLGLVTEVVTESGSTYTYSYDEWMRMVELTAPGSAVYTVEYDEEGAMVGATDAVGRTATRTYDALGRIIESVNGNGDSREFDYDDLSRMIELTNGEGYTRTYTYTDRGQPATLTLPDGAVESWSYSGTGTTTSYTNPLNQTISYTRDDAGRLTGINYPTGTDVALTYDDAGRRATMTDSTGTTTWTHNAAGELVALETPQADIEYTYNLAGQRTTVEEATLGTTTLDYDAAGRLSAITDWFNDETEYVYDSAGRLSRRNLPNGTYELFTYDARDRVDDIVIKNSSNATINTRSYSYNAIGEVTQAVEGSVTTDYEYDLAGQLVEETKSTGYSATYTYDSNGNRLTKTVGASTESYAYDNGDKLTAITGGSDPRTFGYDAAGRTTSIVRASSTTNIAYDYESRVTSITRSGMTTNTYTYNGFGAQVEKTDSTGSYDFMRSGVGPTAPVLADGAAIYTPSGETRSGTETTFHAGVKSNDFETQASQATQGSRVFDAFGLTLSSTGSPSATFGYGGHIGYQMNVDTGFVSVGVRVLDPSTGRFLTRDPSKQEKNWYVYAGNSPVRRADPGGDRSIVLGINAGGFVIGGGADVNFGLGYDIWTGKVAFVMGGSIAAGAGAEGAVEGVVTVTTDDMPGPGETNTEVGIRVSAAGKAIGGLAAEGGVDWEVKPDGTYGPAEAEGSISGSFGAAAGGHVGIRGVLEHKIGLWDLPGLEDLVNVIKDGMETVQGWIDDAAEAIDNFEQGLEDAIRRLYAVPYTWI